MRKEYRNKVVYEGIGFALRGLEMWLAVCTLSGGVRRFCLQVLATSAVSPALIIALIETLCCRGD